MVTDPLYEAMLRIAALRKGSFPPSLDYVSGPFDCFVGPLPGLGTGFFDLVTKSPKSAGSFDTVARALIDEQLRQRLRACGRPFSGISPNSAARPAGLVPPPGGLAVICSSRPEKPRSVLREMGGWYGDTVFSPLKFARRAGAGVRPSRPWIFGSPTKSIGLTVPAHISASVGGFRAQVDPLSAS